ncbi:glycosyltransferase [Moritella sp. 24]|uniref:glycosyltransferase n=1 Tax=Moritella sp. 24 TaxID=2746230 RepID=UPI001BA4E1AD|nr:glycosyltransferase [Moritella sp. 24]QUM75746.1 glycosyltransferase [Moritella sp. 24]
MAKNNRKKIIQVTECFAYGTAKSLKQLCGLLKGDYEITVFYCRRDGTESELKDIDSDITWVEMTSDGPFHHLRNILLVRKFIDQNTFAIHGHSSYGGLYARLAAIGKNLRFVFYSPRGYAFLRQDLSIITRFIFLLGEIFLSFLGHTVTCGMGEFKVGKKFTRRISNINNSVTTKNRPVLPNGRDFKVISVGRICYQKNFDTFLGVATELKDSEFTWIGSSDPSYFEEIMSKYGKLPENVTIIEYIEQSELFKQISESSLLFHPSRWEGLSRVLIESLTLGMPIVTSTCHQNLDCLYPRRDDDVSGEYNNGFACNSVENYICAIQTLKNNPELVSQMRASSFALAKNYFDINTTKIKWLKLYKGEF